jgi:microcystin-dependent protein
MSDQYVAEIRVFPYNFAPSGWAFCSGQTMSISQFQVLFTIIGTTFGGNGTTTFLLPDLRDRLAVGMGTGGGLSPWVLGQVGGTPNVALNINQAPSHTHQATVGDGVAFAAESATPTTTSFLGRVKGDTYSPTSTPGATLSPAAISTAGQSLPHSNLMPAQVMNYNIALVGVFPSRN